MSSNEVETFHFTAWHRTLAKNLLDKSAGEEQSCKELLSSSSGSTAVTGLSAVTHHEGKLSRMPLMATGTDCMEHSNLQPANTSGCTGRDHTSSSRCEDTSQSCEQVCISGMSTQAELYNRAVLGAGFCSSHQHETCWWRVWSHLSHLHPPSLWWPWDAFSQLLMCLSSSQANSAEFGKTSSCKLWLYVNWAYFYS